MIEPQINLCLSLPGRDSPLRLRTLRITTPDEATGCTRAPFQGGHRTRPARRERAHARVHCTPAPRVGGADSSPGSAWGHRTPRLSVATAPSLCLALVTQAERHQGPGLLFDVPPGAPAGFGELGLGRPLLSPGPVRPQLQSGCPVHLALSALILLHYLFKPARPIYSSSERQQPLSSRESGTLRRSRVFSFICRWTLKSLPRPGYCK